MYFSYQHYFIFEIQKSEIEIISTAGSKTGKRALHGMSWTDARLLFLKGRALNVTTCYDKEVLL